MVTSGVYVVKEDGLVFEHNLDPLNTDDVPTTPELFLERFRYVFLMNKHISIYIHITK